MKVVLRVLLLLLVIAIAGAPQWTQGNTLFGLSYLASFFVLCLLPGFSFLALFSRDSKFRPHEILLYSFGLSIFSTILFGLVTNTIGAMAHQSLLKADVVVPAYSTFVALLSIATVLSRQAADWTLSIARSAHRSGLVFGTTLLFPVLAVFGANQLNNTAGGSVSVVTLGLVLAFCLAIIMLGRRLSSSAYAISLYSIALAFLLSVSLRTNHVYGYDIHQELYAFNLTSSTGTWNPEAFKDPYNACLSITILPTMIKDFFGISNEYIFKVVMPMLLAMIGPILYYLSLKVTRRKKLAFISGLYFVGQSQFIFQLSGIVRQQLALVFFALMLLVAVSMYAKKTRSILYFVFGFGMILCHYSTAYVSIALLGFAYVVTRLLAKILERHARHGRHLPDLNYSPILVGVLFLCTFLWYGLVTNSGNGLFVAIKGSITNISAITDNSTRSDFVITSFGLQNDFSAQRGIADLSLQRRDPHGYTSSEVPAPQIMPDPQPSSRMQSLENTVYNRLLPLSLRLCLVVGCILCVYVTMRRREWLGLAGFVVSSVVFFIALAVLPSLSKDFNVERFFQQILTLLAALTILGAVMLAKLGKLNLRAQTAFVGFLVVCYVASTTGFLHAVFLKHSYANLDNNNSSYLKYQTPDSALASLQWLNDNRRREDTVNMDTYSTLSVNAYEHLMLRNTEVGLLPQQIGQTAYVYVSDTDLAGYVADSIEHHAIAYQYPKAFLETHKSLVYSSSTSRIYR